VRYFIIHRDGAVIKTDSLCEVLDALRTKECIALDTSTLEPLGMENFFPQEEAEKSKVTASKPVTSVYRKFSAEESE
jgi:hypothetical protein